MSETAKTREPADELPIAGLGAIDCDVHPHTPGRADLEPYLDDYWRDIFASRDIDHLELMAYPERTRPYRRPGAEITDVAALQRNLLDPLKLSGAILNIVSGIHAVYDPYLATALCQATNRWLVAEWLDRDPRLRASLLVPFQNPEAAVEEIERHAGDKRFVQVLTIAMGEVPLGRRAWWPIYAAAEKHGFALAIHAGSNLRHAPTQSGFPSFLVEEHVVQTQGFANQVGSLIAEGVFGKFPGLKAVLIESGVTWLPPLMWRMSKDWRGARIEVPWIAQAPAGIMRDHLRLTISPFDGPGQAEEAERAIEHLGADDMLLFSTDYPHDRGGDLALWPASLPRQRAPAIARDNVLATYSRLELAP